MAAVTLGAGRTGGYTNIRILQNVDDILKKFGKVVFVVDSAWTIVENISSGNEHWFTDIIAGAGVGILSVRLADWIYPWIQENVVHKIFKPKKDFALMGFPYCSGDGAGISLAMRF